MICFLFEYLAEEINRSKATEKSGAAVVISDIVQYVFFEDTAGAKRRGLSDLGKRKVWLYLEFPIICKGGGTRQKRKYFKHKGMITKATQVNQGKVKNKRCISHLLDKPVFQT